MRHGGSMPPSCLRTVLPAPKTVDRPSLYGNFALIFIPLPYANFSIHSEQNHIEITGAFATGGFDIPPLGMIKSERGGALSLGIIE